MNHEECECVHVSCHNFILSYVVMFVSLIDFLEDTSNLWDHHKNRLRAQCSLGPSLPISVIAITCT